jgi:CheY-like chemotaxis protein
MPVLDGYDATREIRQHSDQVIRNILVIAMTASAIQGDREKCLEAGMNNYLAKPVRVHTLKTLLETYLAQPPKPIPNLQLEGNKLVLDALQEAKADHVDRIGDTDVVAAAQAQSEPEVQAMRPILDRKRNTSERTLVVMEQGIDQSS